MAVPKVQDKLNELHALKATQLHETQRALDTHGPKSEAYRIALKALDETQQDIDLAHTLVRGLARIPTPTPATSAPAPVTAVPTIVRTTTEQEGAQRRDKRAALNAALRYALRNGMDGSREVRDLSTISDSSGAALFGQTFEEQSEWTRAMANFAPLVDKIATKYALTGANRKFVVTDQTEQFMLTIPETTATDAADSTPTLFSNITGNLAPIIGRTTVSFEAISDIDDVVGYLRDGFAVQAGRAQELAILKAVDHAGTALVSSPAGGLLTAAPVGATVATAGAVTPQDIAALTNSLDYSYFLEGDIIVSQAVYAYLAAQLKTTGEYLYPRDEKGNLIVNGKTLMVASNAAMAGMSAAAGTPLMLAGKFAASWAATITPFRLQILEPTPETLTNQVVASFRIGQVGLIANAVKSLVQAS
jgi:HK97 family phage major capsid protein